MTRGDYFHTFEKGCAKIKVFRRSYRNDLEAQILSMLNIHSQCLGAIKIFLDQLWF